MTLTPSSPSSVARAPAVTPKLQIQGLRRDFTVARQRFSALDNVDLVIQPGEFVTVVGASGCGKSTLLRLVVGLDRNFEGDILFDGRPIDGPSLDRAIVFQEHRLLPWLTAEENVALGLLKIRQPKQEKRARVAELLKLVGLSSFATAYPGQLSGGMSQRVAIARALVNNPGLLLLDEPLGALDSLTRTRLQQELRRIVREEGVTALLVTHDVEEAVYLGDRVVIMKPSPGRISEIVPVALGPDRDRQSKEFRRLGDYVLARLHEPDESHAASTGSAPNRFAQAA
jgi:sulfonate transport system ATP-binding protein